MALLPVIDSTLSPEALSVWVAEHYGFHDVSCRLIKTNANHTYKVTSAEGKYVLRIYNYKLCTAAEVCEELKILNILRSNNVSVSYPLAALSGANIAYVLAPEGSRIAVLFSFAEGRKMRFLTEDISKNIGEMVGQFHQVGRGKTINRLHYSVEKLAEWSYTEALKLFSAELEEMKLVKEYGKKLHHIFKDISHLRTGVVHLDIWYDNMSITDNGRITFFDFDNCGNGWLVLDIGYFCLQLFNTEPDRALYERKKAAFIEGYRSVTAVSDEELELIPYAGLAVWVYYLGLQAERFDYFTNFFLSENYLKVYLGRVRRWLEYNDAGIPESS